MVRKKNVITSFSYPIEKIAAVEEAEDYARSKGMSLSELIITCFEGIQQEKNREAGIDLSAVRFGHLPSTIIEPLPNKINRTIDEWLPEIQTCNDIDFYAQITPKIAALQKIASGRYHGLQTNQRKKERQSNWLH